MRPVRYSQLTSSCGGSAASRKSSMNSATNVTAVMAMVAWMPSRMYRGLGAPGGPVIPRQHVKDGPACACPGKVAHMAISCSMIEKQSDVIKHTVLTWHQQSTVLHSHPLQGNTQPACNHTALQCMRQQRLLLEPGIY